MRNLAFVILALGIILVLPGIVLSAKELPESEGTLLSQSELAMLFTKKFAMNYSTVTGGSGTLTYFPNGAVEIVWKGRDTKVNDTGTYRILNGLLCNSWKNIRDGKERCYKLYRTIGNRYRTVSTEVSWK